MPDLIPTLMACRDGNPYGITRDFIDRFLGLHRNRVWSMELHWQRFVAEALDSSAVKRTSTGKIAIREAVREAWIVLNRISLDSGSCPVCLLTATRWWYRMWRR
jgi:hypothetical protein